MSELSRGIAQVVAGLVKGGMQAAASPKKSRKASSTSKPKRSSSSSGKKSSESSVNSGAEESVNAASSRTRVQQLGHGLMTMEDIAPENQHLYREWHGKLYHIGSLSPEVLARMDGDGMKCELGMKIGGNVVVASDRDSGPRDSANIILED